MGTLKNQDWRKRHDVTEANLLDCINMLKAIATKEKISLDQVIKIYEISVQNRHIDAYIDDGDIKDEQLSGLSNYLDEITNGSGITVTLLSEQE